MVSFLELNEGQISEGAEMTLWELIHVVISANTRVCIYKLAAAFTYKTLKLNKINVRSRENETLNT
jgi:hypothetical protein